MAVFWVVAPCSLVEVYQRLRLMMEAARTSETLVNFYHTYTALKPRRQTALFVILGLLVYFMTHFNFFGFEWEDTKRNGRGKL
jgi:hypothetical protein